LFADLEVTVEMRNEARVHLWFEEHFGVPAAPFPSATDAIDHFAFTTCCYGLTRDPVKRHHRLRPMATRPMATKLFAKRLRPNPALVPREVYERKAERWLQPQTTDLATQHRYVMPQHQQLDILGRATATPKGDEAKHRPHDGLHHR
jgi:hypothetical protein